MVFGDACVSIESDSSRGNCAIRLVQSDYMKNLFRQAIPGSLFQGCYPRKIVYSKEIPNCKDESRGRFRPQRIGLGALGW